MKVAFILDSGGMGGAERQAFLLARALKKDDHEVRFFYLSEGDSQSLNHLLDGEGISHVDLGFRFTSRHHTRFIHCIRLSLTLRKYKPEVLLPYTIRPNVNVNFAWQLTGAKLSIWNQRDEGRGIGKKYRDKILWFALRNTSGIISNSDEGFQFIKSYLPKPKPVIQIKNGIELTDCEQRITHPDIQTKKEGYELTISMIANITKYKDHLCLVEAFHDLIQNTSIKAKLILAGNHGDEYPTVSKLITELNLQNHLSTPGSIDDVKSLLCSSDLVVFSSKKEGIPNGVLEAMATKKPIIATDLPGIREALGESYSYLFPQGDSSALAKMMKELITNPDKMNELAQQNHERIKSSFSLSRLKENTIAFINELINE